MRKKVIKKESNKATFARVAAEMAVPRMAKSARKRMEIALYLKDLSRTSQGEKTPPRDCP
jgi:hypothetical protein